MGKKRNFLPKQNTHDLLVGTLSIGIPTLFFKLVSGSLWPFYCFYLMYAEFRSVTAKSGKIPTPTRTGNFLLTWMAPEFYATSKINRNNIKRDIGHHILNVFFLRLKTSTKSKEKPRKRPILPSFEKGTEKSAVIAWETSLFNGCTHTHSSYTHTERDLQLRFGKEKSHQKVKLQQKVKKYHKRYLS